MASSSKTAQDLLRYLGDPEIAAALFASLPPNASTYVRAPLRGLTVAKIRKLSANLAATYVQACDETDVLDALVGKERRVGVRTALAANPELSFDARVKLLCSLTVTARDTALRSFSMRAPFDQLVETVTAFESVEPFHGLNPFRTNHDLAGSVLNRAWREATDDQLAALIALQGWAKAIYRELEVRDPASRRQARRTDAIAGQEESFDVTKFLVQISYLGIELAHRLLADDSLARNWSPSRYSRRRASYDSPTFVEPEAAKLLATSPVWRELARAGLTAFQAGNERIVPLEEARALTVALAALSVVAISPAIFDEDDRLDDATIDALLKGALEDQSSTIRSCVGQLVDHDVPLDQLRASIQRVMVTLSPAGGANLLASLGAIRDFYINLVDVTRMLDLAGSAFPLSSRLTLAREILTRGPGSIWGPGSIPESLIQAVVRPMTQEPSMLLSLLTEQHGQLPAALVVELVEQLVADDADPDATDPVAARWRTAAGPLLCHTEHLSDAARDLLATRADYRPLETWIDGSSPVRATKDQVTKLATWYNQPDQRDVRRELIAGLRWDEMAVGNWAVTVAFAEQLDDLPDRAFPATGEAGSRLTGFVTSYLQSRLSNFQSWQTFLMLNEGWSGNLGDLVELTELATSSESA